MLATYSTMLLDRNTRLILTASLVNSFGTGLFSAVVVLHGIGVTGSAFAVTTGLTAGAIVAVLLTPISAQAVVRFGAKRVVIVLALLRALNCFLIALSPGELFPIFMAAHVVLERFAYPGSQGVLNYVAQGSLRSQTLSFRQLINTVGLALGAWAAAGVLIVFPGASPLLLIVINGVSFIGNAMMYHAILMPHRVNEKQPEGSRVKPKLPVGLTLVSIALAVLMSSGSVVSYGLPLVASGRFEHLKEVVPLVIAMDVSIGALMYAFVTPHIRSIGLARGVFLISAGLCASGVYAFGMGISSGVMTSGLSVAVAVFMSASIALCSFSAYFLFSVPGDSTSEPRYMAAFGLSGTMTRLVYPSFVALAVGGEGGLVLILVLSMTLAALLAWTGMKRVVSRTL